MFNSLRESRKHVYEKLAADGDLASLAIGGILPISDEYTEADRLARGPHVFYYTQGYTREGFRRYRHRLVIEVHVPLGNYTVDGNTLDAYSYSEIMQSAVLSALEVGEHGSGKVVQEIGGGLLIGDGFYVWQIVVETVVVKV